MAAKGDEVLSEGHVRTKTGLFNEFSDLQLIAQLHGQAEVRAATLVGRAFEELECTHSHIGTGMGVVHARRVGSEMETKTHEGEENLFPEARHLEFTEQSKVIEL